MTLEEIHKAIKNKETRFCNCCKEIKDVSEFFIKRGIKENHYRFNSPCKKCSVKNKDKDYLKVYSLKKKYNLSKEEFNIMLLSQNNKCGICDSDLVKPVVDHCHKTGKVRGILCTNCNLGLGNFKDNKEFLLKAISYLG